MRFVDLEVKDIRFPTSRELDGSDAMNEAPDYSAAYVILRTDAPSGPEGHGLTFTIGRGNEVCAEAVRALRPLALGVTLEDFSADPGAFWRRMTGDSQLRWIGPEKGAIHLATAAIVNAAWDMYAKASGKPLWKLLADMPSEDLVRCVDFRYCTDALTAQEALAILKAGEKGRDEREAEIIERGYPAYTTTAGWIGYGEDKYREQVRKALKEGWSSFKIKVGRDIEEDLHRCAVAREEIGWDVPLMLDANQVWDVDAAITHTKALARFKPEWMEEPTSPDDVLGHAAIAKAVRPLGIGVATGEHCQNRVVFKQFFQAGAMDFCQLDCCRLAGVNEVLAVMLMAAKFGVPVCPHAGGVGLCEYVQHVSIFDYLRVSTSLKDRRVEFANHLHEHFVNPARVLGGRYVAPEQPGYSVQMKEEALKDFSFPDGKAWRDEHK